jgi:pimeloyl-ACP methyl ester carboxylesterase
VLGAIDPGEIDPASLDGGVGFFALSPLAHPAQVKACLNCASSPLPDGGPQTSPQRLQFIPTVPLDEKTPYAAFMTAALRDTNGVGVVPSETFALLRLTNPVFDGTHSTLPPSFVTDAQAALLEEIRLALSPLLDALSAQGLPRSEVVLAWAYTTETTVTALRGLHDFAAGVPKLPLGPPVDITNQTLAEMQAAGLPHGSIGKVFFGEIALEFLLTGTGGTLDPAHPLTIRTPFLLTLPSTPAPGAGYPVTVYGHGLTGNRTNMLAIADALAGGGLAPVPGATPRASIAIDTVWHGARTSCTGAAVFFPPGATDDAACVDPTKQKCDEGQPVGKCIARDATTRTACNPDPTVIAFSDLGCSGGGQGFCLTDQTGLLADGGSVCAGGDFKPNPMDGQPAISGWNMIRIDNFFAFRDNFRYPVTDSSVLREVLGQDVSVAGSLNALLSAQAAGTLSTSDVTWVGQSLGALLGMNYTAVAPEISTVVLAPTGGNLPLIGLTSPAFAPITDLYLAALAAQGIVAGTPQYDDLFAINQWILDPGDPLNSAWNVLNSSLSGVNLPANRAAFVQYIDQDEVIPNPTTVLVLDAFQRGGPTPAPKVHFFSAANGDPMPALGHRHAFLVNYNTPQTTAKAQAEAVKFANTGMYP